MEWTFTAAADRKILGPSQERFIFNEVVQQVAADEDFAGRLNELKPHITVYDPNAARDALLGERVLDEANATPYGIDLAGDGGAQLVCAQGTVFVNLYVGKDRYDSLSREIERSLESSQLAISMTFSIPELSYSRVGDIKFEQGAFLTGRPLFFGTLPALSLVRKVVP